MEGLQGSREMYFQYSRAEIIGENWYFVYHSQAGKHLEVMKAGYKCDLGLNSGMFVLKYPTDNLIF